MHEPQPQPQPESVRVAVVTLAAAASLPAILAELRRAAMLVEEVTGDVLQAPPTLPIYVISAGATVAGMLADKIVAWAAASELRPGLIGLVEDARPRDCEALLAAGFDDALGAPVSPRELAGRVRALHRRVHWTGAPSGRLRFGGLTLDLHGRALWAEGRTIPLTSAELGVVRELMKARGRPLSRTELLDVAWGEGELEVSERAVDNVVLRLRRKLPRPDLIETVRGVGFRIAPRAP